MFTSLRPKKKLSQPKMNESFEIKLCQEKQHHKKYSKTHTCTQKKTHKIVLKCAHKSKQIFGKLWAKTWNNKRQNQHTHNIYIYIYITPRDKTNTHKNATVFKFRLKTWTRPTFVNCKLITFTTRNPIHSNPCICDLCPNQPFLWL